MIVIDGSLGEGGGQMLRTALSLSLITGKPFKLVRIRAGRERPGLQPQHLAAVKAAADIGRARTSGASLRSSELRFEPGKIRGGSYQWDIGTAGNTSLVAQTLLLPLLFADQPSTFSVKGGTCTTKAPPFRYLLDVYFPLLRRAGVSVHGEISKEGFYPVGGGVVSCSVEPSRLSPLTILTRGALLSRRARACVARLPQTVGERELQVLRRTLGLSDDECEVVELQRTASPGNAIFLTLSYEGITEMISAIGEKGVLAEQVAELLGIEAHDYLSNDAPVGPHLADQLLLVCALAGEGKFLTTELTEHTRTNREVIREFLDVSIDFHQADTGWIVSLGDDARS